MTIAIAGAAILILGALVAGARPERQPVRIRVRDRR